MVTITLNLGDILPKPESKKEVTSSKGGLAEKSKPLVSNSGFTEPAETVSKDEVDEIISLLNNGSSVGDILNLGKSEEAIKEALVINRYMGK